MADNKEEERNSLPIPTDDEWCEVKFINSYAMTMAYLAMGVRGLAFLVVTWTTVVLLGGFVGVLSKKDFWALTVIILAQTAGVFDVFLREKLSKIHYVYVGLAARNVLSIDPIDYDDQNVLSISICEDIIRPAVIALLKTAIQALVLSVVLCPLAAVYMFGLVISTVISLWRLIEQDYGGGGGSSNLKPALQVLYSLGLVQGVLFCCRFLFAGTEKKLIMRISESYNFGRKEGKDIISDYLRETRIGCEKDPTFAKGRNLITYAVDLIKSEAPDKVISGVRILERLVSMQDNDEMINLDCLGQHMLIKVLVGSASSSGILLHKLVQMLDPRCPYTMETRRCAATIVAHLAGDIHLEQFPRGLHCITSLLNEEYSEYEPYERDWLLETFDNEPSPDEILARYRQAYVFSKNQTPYRLSLSMYRALAVQGLRILCKLARDEENCRVMCNAQGLISKIIATIPSSPSFHQDDHPEWSKMATRTVQLLVLLTRTPGKSGQKLQRQISTNTQAVNALVESILRCNECSGSLKGEAIVMLSGIYFHKSASKSTASEQSRRQSFVQMLIDNFADDNQAIDTREAAGAELAKLSSESNHSKATVTLILEERGAISSLTGVILDTKDSNETSSLRTIAEEILKNIFSHCKKDDECFAKLKTDLTDDVLPMVLREIVRYAGHRTGYGKHTADKADIKGFSPPDADIEKGAASENTISSPQQNAAEQLEDWKLQEALLSLCDMLHNKFTSEDPDLARQFDEIAATICLEQVQPVKTFTRILEEARQQLLDAKKAQELAIVPAVTESSSRET